MASSHALEAFASTSSPMQHDKQRPIIDVRKAKAYHGTAHTTRGIPCRPQWPRTPTIRKAAWRLNPEPLPPGSNVSTSWHGPRVPMSYSRNRNWNFRGQWQKFHSAQQRQKNNGMDHVCGSTAESRPMWDVFDIQKLSAELVPSTAATGHESTCCSRSTYSFQRSTPGTRRLAPKLPTLKDATAHVSVHQRVFAAEP